MNYNFKSSEESKKQLGEHTLFGSIQVYTINPLPDNVNLGAVLQSVEEKIPKIFFHNVDSVYIGQFEEFEEKQVNAMYRDGAIERSVQLSLCGNISAGILGQRLRRIFHRRPPKNKSFKSNPFWSHHHFIRTIQIG